MTQRMKAAIVGFGGMGQRHFHAYEGAGIDVVAIAEFQPDRVTAAAPAFPRDRVFADYRALLDAVPDLDLVSVVSNGPTHAEIAIEAMTRGVPRVLCEKPIATRLSDADRVIACAAQHGARLSVNHARRWSADYARIRELIASGAIGRLRHSYFSCGSTGLGNFVSHAFDTMRFLFECEPVSVTAWIDQAATPNPRGASFADPGGHGVVLFEGGQRGMFDASEDTGVQYVFNLVGEYGRIVIDELSRTWSVRRRSDDTRSAPLTRYGSPFVDEPFEPVEDYDLVTLTRRALVELAGGGPLSCTGLDGRRALEMVVACHESHAAGHRPVALPLTGAALEREIRIG